MSKFTKHDDGKLLMTSVTPEFRTGLAEVLTFGAAKYGKHNWKKGADYTRLLDSVYRHLAAFEMGQDMDPESGLPHLHHAATNIMFIAYFAANPEKYKQFDDRKGSQLDDK